MYSVPLCLNAPQIERRRIAIAWCHPNFHGGSRAPQRATVSEWQTRQVSTDQYFAQIVYRQITIGTYTSISIGTLWTVQCTLLGPDNDSFSGGSPFGLQILFALHLNETTYGPIKRKDFVDSCVSFCVFVADPFYTTRLVRRRRLCGGGISRIVAPGPEELLRRRSCRRKHFDVPLVKRINEVNKTPHLHPPTP